MSEQKGSEKPECDPVPLHRASRHVGTDITPASLITTLPAVLSCYVACLPKFQMAMIWETAH
jgi:hypothetical protein